MTKKEILENLFNEEYDRLEKEHPQFNPMAIAILAHCYAMKRWEIEASIEDEEEDWFLSEVPWEEYFNNGKQA